MIIHVPHSSFHIPISLRSDLLLTNDELTSEMNLLTDTYTDLFAVECSSIPGVETIVFQYSRILVDVERFTNPEQEIMEQVGMGCVYTKTSKGTPLRIMTDEKREQLINLIYQPHHIELEKKVTNELKIRGRCIIFDLHSFPSTPFPYEPAERRSRPDFCIGTDEYHTPTELTTGVKRLIESEGFTVDINWPYTGAIVPEAYYHKDSRVQSFMIEINRALYMNEVTMEKTPGFVQVSNLIKLIASYFS